MELNQVSSSSSLALPIKVGEQIIKGSGGIYLSNEIFYRVSVLRNFLKLNDTLKSGHLHVPILNIDDMPTASNYVDEVKKIIQDAINGL